MSESSDFRGPRTDRERPDAGKPMRPLSVRKHGDHWDVVDLGGRVGLIAGSLLAPRWVPTPIRATCCHATAVRLADVIAQAYRRDIPRVAVGPMHCAEGRCTGGDIG